MRHELKHIQHVRIAAAEMDPSGRKRYQFCETASRL